MHDQSEEAAGKQLFEMLKCQQCHVLGAIPKDQPTANLAPDLRMASERLNPDWMRQWLKNPADISAGHADAGVLAGGLPEVALSAARAATPRRRSARSAAHLLTLKGGPSPRRKGSGAVAAAATN